MKLLICTLVVLLSSSTLVQSPSAKGYVPPSGFVPDSATAVRIAVAVWIPIYGAAHIGFRAALCRQTRP